MTIGFIGGGNMAHAIVSGLIATESLNEGKSLNKGKSFNGENCLNEGILVADPKPSAGERFQALSPRVEFTQENQDVFSRCSVLILAVKPQQIATVLSNIGTEYPPEQLIISVAAGVSCASIKAHLPASVAVIRAMPNTPALIGAGITALFSDEASTDERIIAETIFAAVGQVLWVEKEIEIQAVTATSGSGPAYFFALMEMMVKSAQALGLAPEQAYQLVTQTALGASQLAQKSPAKLAALREQVTSPGGTTEAGLKVLRTPEQQQKIDAVLRAAYQRAIELEKQ